MHFSAHYLLEEVPWTKDDVKLGLEQETHRDIVGDNEMNQSFKNLRHFPSQTILLHLADRTSCYQYQPNAVAAACTVRYKHCQTPNPVQD